MKNLEQIKNEYAVSVGFRDWYHLSMNFTDYDKHWYNVCVLAQKECLKLASDKIDTSCFISQSDYIYTFKEVKNENNIIK